MANKATKSIKYIVGIGLAVVLVWLALRGVDWKVFIAGLSQTRWAYVLLAGLMTIVSNFFRNERWRDMMVTIDPQASRIRLWDSINIGNLVSLVVPWVGILVRAGAVKGSKASYDKTLGTIFMERTWDSLMMVLIMIAAILANSSDIGRFFVDQVAGPVKERLSLYVWIAVFILIVLAIAAIWAVFHFKDRSPLLSKLAGWLDGLFVGFKSFKDVHYKSKFILYSVLIWIPYVLMCWFIFKAIPQLEALNFADALFISTVGSLAALVPVPGGFGAYHYLTALAISSIYGATWETGILFATLNHESRVVVLIIVGAISAINAQVGGKKKGQPVEAGPVE